MNDCLYAYRGSSCTNIWHGLTNPYVRRVPLPRSDEEVADLGERDRLWEQRCHPVVRQDMYGVRRYVYAARGCEYGRYE